MEAPEIAAPGFEIPTSARIYVAGHRGLVGSAIVRRLEARGLRQPAHRQPRASSTCATRRRSTRWFDANRPEYVFLVAGTVGGILRQLDPARPSSSTTT